MTTLLSWLSERSNTRATDGFRREGLKIGRRVVILALLLIGAGSVGAQEYLLVNESEEPLYVRYLPEAGPGDIADLRSLLGDGSLLQLPPHGVIPIPEVSGTVAGFAFIRSASVYPGFVIGADSVIRDDERAYMVVPAAIIESPAGTIAAGEVVERIAGVRVDNRYVDWLQVDPIISVPPDRAPLGVFREAGDGREEATLAGATLWERGGTDLETVKTLTRNRQVFLHFAARSSVSASRSIFLYVRDSDRSIGTVEITGGSPAALVLYWPAGAREPLIIGSAVNAEFFTEALFDADLLTELLGVSEASVEVAVGLRDGGLWEEFVISETTLSALMGD